MDCVFIVQASVEIGLGHLMRCLALSQAMVTRGINTRFLLDSKTSQIAKARLDWCGEIIEHDYELPVDRQIKGFESQFDGIPDWILIDGYQFEGEYCEKWQRIGAKTLLFDDGIHSSPYGADVLLGAVSETKKDPNVALALNGDDYRLLRREFVDVSPLPILQRKYLTLAFGGSDPLNLTLHLLRVIENNKLKFPIKVVTGASYSHLSELESFLRDTNLSVKHIHAAQNMAAEWADSILAVSAAGGSQFELALCETPSILVIVAENQRVASEQASKEGWCSVHDFSFVSDLDLKLNQLYRNIVMLLSDNTLLEKMHDNIVGKYDAKGADRVIEALQNFE
jgi:UDP-2,4-diacetamido-2,4,6-trideoxy-beta-L-altropyranose hydrolase